MLLGIDPGTRSLGLALTEDTGMLVWSKVLSMKNDNIYGMIEDIWAEIPGASQIVKHASIERFVSYGMPMSKTSEQITMIIGGLIYSLSEQDIPVSLYRAIEWKPALCKYLVKKYGFDNPSNKFDKKFDLAAAKCITGKDLPTDHEADAVCLAYMWNVK